MIRGRENVWAPAETLRDAAGPSHSHHGDSGNRVRQRGFWRIPEIAGASWRDSKKVAGGRARNERHPRNPHHKRIAPRRRRGNGCFNVPPGSAETRSPMEGDRHRFGERFPAPPPGHHPCIVWFRWSRSFLAHRPATFLGIPPGWEQARCRTEFDGPAPFASIESPANEFDPHGLPKPRK